MTVATFNMRNANRGDSINGNGWGQRYPYIADMIRFHGFDIFGTQECKDYQLDDLKAVLPGYDYIGVGRDDGKRGGEFAAIFYDTNKFDLLDNGNFWLSTNTEEPNKGWDAALPRICSWGKFKNKNTGFTFYFYNLHMDHIGVEARKESAKLILQKLKELPGEAPMILTGDFNVDQNNESYTLLETSGLMEDAYTKAEFKYAPNGTFNNFKTNLFTDSRIDHIFLTPQFKVKKYGILTDTYRSAMTEKELADTGGNFPEELKLEKNMARTPSDHFPVVAIVECD
jgi:endonuclease/exonuclease/phosphatase family metal-dependent hydrolase